MAPGSSELEIRAPGRVAVTLGVDVRAGESVLLAGAVVSTAIAGLLLVLEWPRARPARRVGFGPGGVELEARF